VFNEFNFSLTRHTPLGNHKELADNCDFKKSGIILFIYRREIQMQTERKRALKIV
jgi:hypothetical protein